MGKENKRWKLKWRRYYGMSMIRLQKSCRKLDMHHAVIENAARTAKLLYKWRRASKPRISKRRAILDEIARRELRGDDG